MESLSLGTLTSPFKAEDVPFWQVVGHNLPFLNTELGGQFSVIAGLCYPKHVPAEFAVGTSDATLVDRLSIESFAFCLPSASGSPGFLTMGPLQDLLTDTAKFNFRAVPVVTESHWAVRIDNVAFGFTSLDDVCSPSCAALIDSGSSMLLVPPAVMAALERYVPAAALPFRCESISKLPDLVLKIGGHRIVLPPKAYMVEDSSYPGGAGACVPAVRAVDRSSDLGPLWSLGIPFLRQHYTVFDRSGPSLHVADGPRDCQQHAAASQVPAQAVNLVAPGIEAAWPVRVDMRAVHLPSWT